ncbi:MAG: glucosamine-6-phosphate deaminase [Olpidium bornovanus]|uniref:glucosamine-6-phosphate deaminase n=1 Tax=Olpidium bornovanus TaxID=278681 RepID=A0A8H8DH32_9FUNG|nr:MAG: glucosamine-6-phosphate deaminase [Olpidium bornovanus]
MCAWLSGKTSARWPTTWDRIDAFSVTEERPFVLRLPTGSSPVRVYERLVKYVECGNLSFKNVVTFNMDEYVGVDRNHPQSYWHFKHARLFDKVDIRPENINLLNGNAADLEEECRKYEEKIAYYGGIELFLGGRA